MITRSTHFLSTDLAVRAELSRLLLAGYDSGVPVTQIAHSHGVHPATVRKAIRALGIELSGRKQWETRFWAKVQKRDDGCWLWTAHKDRKGYGRYSRPGRSDEGAHRVAYEIVNGPIQGGLTVDHLCAVRHCVNPDHLRVCTNRDNVFAPWSKSTPHMNANKAHCSRGHEYAGGNLYIDPKRGFRQCRACNRIRVRLRRVSER